METSKDFKDRSIDELKVTLDFFGVHYDTNKKTKKYYIELLEKKFNELNSSIDLPVNGLDINVDEMETADKDFKVKTQKLSLLSHKRELPIKTLSPIRQSSNKEYKSQTFKKSTIPNERELVSSKSIRNFPKEESIARTSGRVDRVNNAFNNAKITTVQSFIKSKTNSYISTNSNNRQKHKITPAFNLSAVDYVEICKVTSGSFAIFALIYYLNKCDINNIRDSFTAFYSSNQDKIIYGIAATAIVVFCYSLFEYIRKKGQYEKLCMDISQLAYEDIMAFFSEKKSDSRQSFLEEGAMIGILSEKYGYEQEKFINDIYKPHLKILFQNNSLLMRRDLVEDGEIKVFWVYSDENIDDNEDIEINTDD